MGFKITYTPSNQIKIELEASDQKDLFEQMSKLQEVLSHNKCGKCDSNDIVFAVRVVDDNKYYELQCQTCTAVLAFGAHKKGETLFPKRYETIDGEKKWFPDDGWTRWDAKTKSKV